MTRPSRLVVAQRLVHVGEEDRVRAHVDREVGAVGHGRAVAAGAAHALDLDLETQADGVGLADPLVRRALGLGAEAGERLEAHGPAVVQRDDGLEDGGDGAGVVEDVDDGRAPLRERGGVAGGVVHAVQPSAVEGDHAAPPGLGRGEPLVHGRHRVDRRWWRRRAGPRRWRARPARPRCRPRRRRRPPPGDGRPSASWPMPIHANRSAPRRLQMPPASGDASRRDATPASRASPAA